ncbi:MAG TPA: hypothetical protein VK668_17105 [Mucilaginibacter sp.]|nr:hypothetical protein [Mucilaginibacter sp.]
MKKLLLFAAISFFAYTTKAQSLNFEGTVKYIKDKVECCEMYSHKIDIKQDGSIIISGKENFKNSFNLFDLCRDKTQYNIREEDAKYGFGYCPSNNSILFQLSPTSSESIYFKTKEENLRIINAFKRLLVVCTKGKDPFDK